MFLPIGDQSFLKRELNTLRSSPKAPDEAYELDQLF